MERLAKTKLIWLAVALVPLLVAVGCGAETQNPPPITTLPPVVSQPESNMQEIPQDDQESTSVNNAFTDSETPKLVFIIPETWDEIRGEVVPLFPESATQQPSK